MLEDVKLRPAAGLEERLQLRSGDVGDGVACSEFTSKMNSPTPTSSSFQKSIAKVKKDFKALVIHKRGLPVLGRRQSRLALFAANTPPGPEIENPTASGQQTYKALKYALLPGRRCALGHGVGGGCEILLHPTPFSSCRDLHRPRRGRRRPAARLGGCEMLARWAKVPKLPKDRCRSAQVRDDLHRQGGELGGRARRCRSCGWPTASTHEPLSVRRRQASRRCRWWRAISAGAGGGLRLAGCLAAARWAAVDGFWRQGKATDYDRVVSAAAKVLTGADTDMLIELSGGRPLRSRARGLHGSL